MFLFGLLFVRVPVHEIGDAVVTTRDLTLKRGKSLLGGFKSEDRDFPRAPRVERC